MANQTNRVILNYGILEQLRLPNGMYRASTSSDYSFTWLRDTFYEVMPYLDKDCLRYEETYHRILDMFREYEWKLDYHSVHKPQWPHEYIHAKFDCYTVRECDMPWGHAQHDAVGAILFGIGQGIKAGKRILRDEKDREIVQKIVNYLGCCEYWADPDNGMWEEWREVHASSVGAVIAGLKAVNDIVDVPAEWISKGYHSLAGLFPRESHDRPVDLAQLSLVYPYRVMIHHDAQVLVDRVESILLRKRGVLRYLGDSYYATNEHEGRHHDLKHYIGYEAEWTFGLPWLAICHMELGNYDKALEYINWTEEVMLEDGRLPELYFSNSPNYNGNTPLGWSQAMYILAKEMYEAHTTEEEIQ